MTRPRGSMVELQTPIYEMEFIVDKSNQRKDALMPWEDVRKEFQRRTGQHLSRTRIYQLHQSGMEKLRRGISAWRR
jgi:hypothetical protein